MNQRVIRYINIIFLTEIALFILSINNAYIYGLINKDINTYKTNYIYCSFLNNSNISIISKNKLIPSDSNKIKQIESSYRNKQLALYDLLNFITDHNSTKGSKLIVTQNTIMDTINFDFTVLDSIQKNDFKIFVSYSKGKKVEEFWFRYYNTMIFDKQNQKITENQCNQEMKRVLIKNNINSKDKDEAYYWVHSLSESNDVTLPLLNVQINSQISSFAIYIFSVFLIALSVYFLAFLKYNKFDDDFTWIFFNATIERKRINFIGFLSFYIFKFFLIIIFFMFGAFIPIFLFFQFEQNLDYELDKSIHIAFFFLHCFLFGSLTWLVLDVSGHKKKRPNT